MVYLYNDLTANVTSYRSLRGQGFMDLVDNGTFEQLISIRQRVIEARQDSQDPWYTALIESRAAWTGRATRIRMGITERVDWNA
jgi:hypothetical protein